MKFSHRSLRACAIGATAAMLVLGLSACSGAATITAQKAVAASATIYATARFGFEQYAALPSCSKREPALPADNVPCSDPAKVVAVGQKLLLARDSIELAQRVVSLLPANTTVNQLAGPDATAVANATNAASDAATVAGALK